MHLEIKVSRYDEVAQQKDSNTSIASWNKATQLRNSDECLWVRISLDWVNSQRIVLIAASLFYGDPESGKLGLSGVSVTDLDWCLVFALDQF